VLGHLTRDAWPLAPAAAHDTQVLPALFEKAAERVGYGVSTYHDPTQAPALLAREVVL
jgi:hypothetical protein